MTVPDNAEKIMDDLEGYLGAFNSSVERLAKAAESHNMDVLRTFVIEAYGKNGAVVIACGIHSVIAAGRSDGDICTGKNMDWDKSKIYLILRLVYDYICDCVC